MVPTVLSEHKQAEVVHNSPYRPDHSRYLKMLGDL